MPAERRISWDAGSWATAGLALAAAVWALSAGVAPHRLRPVAGFLALWFGAASAVLATKWAARRRAARLQVGSVPRGVRLVQPVWIRITDTFESAAVGAAIGSVAALVGFPGVGLGILLTFGGITGTTPFWPLLAAPALTFEPSGLRVHQNRMEFVVPWASVLEVTSQKTPGKWFTNVRVADPAQIIASVTPDSPRNRSSVSGTLQRGTPRGQALRLWDWTAGLDTITLTRALREAIGDRSASVN